MYAANRAKDYRILHVNPAYEQITDIPKSQAIGALASELYGTGEAPFLEIYSRVADSGINENFEIYWPPMDKHFKVSAISLRRGRFATIFFDISEVKRAEQATKENLERYRRLAESTHEAVAISREGKIIEMGKQIEAIYGHSHAEIMEMGIEKLIHPADRKMVFDNMKNKIEGPYRHRGIRKDGQVIQLEIRAGSILLQGEEHRLTVIRDITEIMEMQESLLQSEKMRAIGQLAGGVAHDFNNQLAGISGYAEMLREEIRDFPKLSRYAEFILVAAKRAADLTAQLLTFSRKGKYLSIKVNIHNILSEVVSILERTIDKRIVIHLDYQARGPIIIGDPTQIENAFLNIALNARDAMPDGGELIISTAMKILEEDYCTTSPFDIKPGNYLSIIFTDNGMGMSQDIIKKIFEPFYTTKVQNKGTGMGLASVYGAVKLHGGEIKVYSELKKGTTVNVLFPVDSEARISPIRENLDEPSPMENVHVLLVDDEEMIRDTTSKMLEKLGCQVSKCRDGKEALELFAAKWDTIDLVILDMILPGINGKETFLKMKNINPQVRALLSSGFSLNGEIQSALDEGALGFIQKPYGRMEFSRKIAEILSLTKSS